MKARYRVGDKVVIVDSLYYVGEIGTIKSIGMLWGRIAYTIDVPHIGKLSMRASSIRLYKRRGKK